MLVSNMTPKSPGPNRVDLKTTTIVMSKHTLAPQTSTVSPWSSLMLKASAWQIHYVVCAYNKGGFPSLLHSCCERESDNIFFVYFFFFSNPTGNVCVCNRRLRSIWFGAEGMQIPSLIPFPFFKNPACDGPRNFLIFRVRDFDFFARQQFLGVVLLFGWMEHVPGMD